MQRFPPLEYGMYLLKYSPAILSCTVTGILSPIGSGPSELKRMINNVVVTERKQVLKAGFLLYFILILESWED